MIGKARCTSIHSIPGMTASTTIGGTFVATTKTKMHKPEVSSSACNTLKTMAHMEGRGLFPSAAKQLCHTQRRKERPWGMTITRISMAKALLKCSEESAVSGSWRAL